MEKTAAVQCEAHFKKANPQKKKEDKSLENDEAVIPRGTESMR